MSPSIKQAPFDRTQMDIYIQNITIKYIKQDNQDLTNQRTKSKLYCGLQNYQRPHQMHMEYIDTYVNKTTYKQSEMDPEIIISTETTTDMCTGTPAGKFMNKSTAPPTVYSIGVNINDLRRPKSESVEISSKMKYPTNTTSKKKRVRFLRRVNI